MNIVVPLLLHGEQQPDSIALSHGQKQLTYSALADRMKKVAQGLARDGLFHDKIAILSSNRMEFIEVFLGSIYAGCIPVPLDPKWSSAELKATLELCQPKLIVAEQNLAEHFIVPDHNVRLLTFSDDETGSYDSWMDALTPDAELDNSNECLFIGFTSGTTGRPKGFMRTHSSWIASFAATSEAFGLNPLEHFMAPGPFSHSLSLFALMQSLHSGATFHIVRQFNAPKVMELCRQVPKMIMFVVPTMIEALMQTPVRGEVHIQALISSGGKWSESSKHKCREVFGGTQLYEYYGSSEASYISYMNVYEDNKPNSLGRPFAGVEVSIRDDNLAEVPAGETGHLYIKSDMMFTGYYGLPDETAAVFHEGWLKLGDYISQDEAGYLHLAGRAKNMIVSGGLNVFPEEVEAVLQQIPEIQEVMVVGVPDEYWGEKVIALVKWRGENGLSAEQIKQYCRQHLASYKSPKQLITVDKFIYTSSGKMAREAMKDYVRRVMI